jgi:hypothetical protein
MTLSTHGTVLMVVIIAAAVIAMVTVLATANKRNAHLHHQPDREERPDRRYPGLNPEAARRHAELAGDDTTESVEPGGHVIHHPYPDHPHPDH